MGAGTPDRVKMDTNAEKSSEEKLLSPPKRNNAYESFCHQNEVEFVWHRKIMTLPRLSAEIQHALSLYEQMKTTFKYVGFACDIAQWTIIKLWSVLMVVLFTQPMADLTYNVMRKVKFWDDLICHQLDFIEAKLRNVDTRIIYKPGGLIDRFILLLHISLRAIFFFPRITWAMCYACYRVLVTEIMTNITLLLKLFEVPKERRSKRVKGAVHKSPGRKRKHEEEVQTSELPEYFVCVNYDECSDPDYEPASDDDTEVTSASEHSHIETDEEEHEVQLKNESPKKIHEITEKNEQLPAVIEQVNVN